jgi:hypothetical protein
MPFIGTNTLAYTLTTVWIEKQGSTLGLGRLWPLGGRETFLFLRSVRLGAALGIYFGILLSLFIQSLRFL